MTSVPGRRSRVERRAERNGCGLAFAGAAAFLAACMVAALRKYGFVFSIGLQNALVYRWNFLLRSAFSLVHLVVVFTLWGAAFAGKPLIGGFTQAQTITYFLVVLALQFMIGAFNEDYQVGEEIRNGLINQFLLKPINYFGYRFSQFVASRLISGLMVCVPFIAIYPLVGDQLALPHELWRVPAGLAAMGLAAIIQFTIAFCFGLMAFWFLEIQGFVILAYAAETFLSGAMLPLDLLPPTAQKIAMYLPFAYQMYFPAGILTGRVAYADVPSGLLVQLGWVIVLLAVAKVLWNQGLKKHTAVGG